MSINSQSLFHFTPRLDYLKGILKEGFRHSFLPEVIPFGGYMESPVTVMSAVKAICFCDIPLSMSDEPRTHYGQYALAMDREWGMMIGATPIRYIHSRSPDLTNYTAKKFIELDGGLRARHSDIFTFYMNYLRESGYEDPPTEDDVRALPRPILKLIDLVSADFKEMFSRSFGLMGLSRVYSGKWKDREQGSETTRVFYDEREWRDVAPAGSSANLTFKLKHVKHIIVTTREEASDLVDFVLTIRDEEQLDVSTAAEVWERIIIRSRFMKDL